MRMFRWPLVVVALAVVVSGCQSVRELAGQGKRPPDEFSVYSRTPLSMPPNFSLTPPVAGATPEAASARADARQALLGSRSQPSGPATYGQDAAEAAAASLGLAALLDRSGGAGASPEIRAIVNRETTILAEADASLTERLMFWTKPANYGAVVDPAKEARRIQDNQALGKPIIAGATPTIERKRRALLEGIF